jgi:hypothetical protein
LRKYDIIVLYGEVIKVENQLIDSSDQREVLLTLRLRLAASPDIKDVY